MLFIHYYKGRDSRLKRVKSTEDASHDDAHKTVIYKDCINLVTSSSELTSPSGLCHTQTGRDVSLLKDTRAHKQLQISPPLLWKPSLNTNCRKSHLAMYPTLAVANNHSNGNHDNNIDDIEERANDSENDIERSYKNM